MIPNRLSIVQWVAQQHPIDATTPQGQFKFLLYLLTALPEDEGWGFLLKPMGENIAPYQGRNVSLSRICYPTGQFVKVVSDSGPGGANAPIWTDEGLLHEAGSAGCIPLDVVPVPTTPSHVVPYPGDAFWDGVGVTLEGDYHLAHEALNARSGRWFGRTIWDATAGDQTGQVLPLEQSVTKHRQEWRAALGLPPI